MCYHMTERDLFPICIQTIFAAVIVPLLLPLQIQFIGIISWVFQNGILVALNIIGDVPPSRVALCHQAV